MKILVFLLLAISTKAATLTISTNPALPRLLIGTQSKASFIDLSTNLSRSVIVYTYSQEIPELLDFKKILEAMKPEGSLTNFWQYDEGTGAATITTTFRSYYLGLVSMMGRSAEIPITVAQASAQMRVFTNVWKNPYTLAISTNLVYELNHDSLIRFYRMHSTYKAVGDDDLYLLDCPVPLQDQARTNYNALITRFGTWFEPPLPQNAGVTGPFTVVSSTPTWLLDRKFWIKNKLMRQWSQTFTNSP